MRSLAFIDWSDASCGNTSIHIPAGNVATDLRVLPGCISGRALDVNDLGAVVGSSTSSSGDRAVIWTQARIRDLIDLASADSEIVFVEAHSINNTGQMLVMGTSTHHTHGTAEAAAQCAPSPPKAFLLKPASN